MSHGVSLLSHQTKTKDGECSPGQTRDPDALGQPHLQVLKAQRGLAPRSSRRSATYLNDDMLWHFLSAHSLETPGVPGYSGYPPARHRQLLVPGRCLRAYHKIPGLHCWSPLTSSGETKSRYDRQDIDSSATTGGSEEFRPHLLARRKSQDRGMN
jgi:hypothetical protein